MPDTTKTPTLTFMGTQDRFVARESELEAIASMMEQRRLITVLGPGGVGKTRFVAELARRDERVVAFVDLVGARSVVGVIGAMQSALGGSAGNTPEAMLQSTGGGWIVLDNFEQLVESSVLTLDGWLERVPEARVLVTSRRPLGLRRETLFELSPLGLGGERGMGDAEALFIDRAAISGPPPTRLIRDICAKLDGLPLAIEMAASRTRTLSLEQLRDRLSRDLRLNARLKDLPPRHQSLQALIDWSWNLLDPGLQSALMRCAVFPNDFSLGSALALIGAEEHEALEALSGLIDHSLVQRIDQENGARRFRLFVPVREFAQNRLTQHPERESIHRAFVEHFSQSALSRIHDHSVEGKAWPLVEVENIETSIDIALSLTPLEADSALILTRTMRRARLHWDGDDSLARLFDKVLRHTRNTGSARFYVPVISIGVGITITAGKRDIARNWAREAVALAETTQDNELMGIALYSQGNLLCHDGHTQRGVSTLRLAKERLGETEIHYWKGLVDQHIGYHTLNTEDFSGAEALFQSSLHHYQAAGSLREQMLVKGGLGLCLQNTGANDEAIKIFLEVRDFMETIGDQGFRAIALRHLGHAHSDQGRLDKAQAFFMEAQVIQTKLGNRKEHALSEGGLGHIHHERGELDLAREHYWRVIDVVEELSFERQSVWFKGWCAVLDLEMGLESGQALIDALKTAEENGWDERARPLSLGTVANVIASARHALMLGREEDAVQALTDARERLDAAQTWKPHHRVMAVILRRFMATVALGLRTLVVGPKGRWFQLPDGQVVDFRRRRATRRLAWALAEHHRSARGEPLDGTALMEAGWPGDRSDSASLLNRLHVALNVLRGLGFRELLLFRDDGWLLDPSMALSFDPRDKPPSRAPSDTASNP